MRCSICGEICKEEYEEEGLYEEAKGQPSEDDMIYIDEWDSEVCPACYESNKEEIKEHL